MVTLNSIDLNLGERLKVAEFRREWFRAELESLVPEQFRELRELRGCTQAQLAEMAEMKQSAVSRFESSTDAAWKLETLLRLADALDAKLSVSLEPSEQVIARYSNQSGSEKHSNSVMETNRKSALGTSVPGNVGRGIKKSIVEGAALFVAPTQMTVNRRCSISEGDNPWN